MWICANSYWYKVPISKSSIFKLPPCDFCETQEYNNFRCSEYIMSTEAKPSVQCFGRKVGTMNCGIWWTLCILTLYRRMLWPLPTASMERVCWDWMVSLLMWCSPNAWRSRLLSLFCFWELRDSPTSTSIWLWREEVAWLRFTVGSPCCWMKCSHPPGALQSDRRLLSEV